MRVDPLTPMQRLQSFIDAADKQLAFLSKVVRTDPDATGAQCKEKIEHLNFLLRHMRQAQHEAWSDGGSVSSSALRQICCRADEMLQPITQWCKKNRKSLLSHGRKKPRTGKNPHQS